MNSMNANMSLEIEIGERVSAKIERRPFTTEAGGRVQRTARLGAGKVRVCTVVRVRQLTYRVTY